MSYLFHRFVLKLYSWKIRNDMCDYILTRKAKDTINKQLNANVYLFYYGGGVEL